ncbi:MAG: hypothetical protein Q9184_004425 [Pyrenodesmia sp. 2 TL-2023]
MSGRIISRSHHIHVKSAILLSPSLRSSPRVYHPAPPHHEFYTSQCIRSPLFNLAGLSASRESQYLSKERGIPRTEFSPHLELIRSSEVDTQQAPGSRKDSSSTANTLSHTTEDNISPLTQESIAIPQTEYAALNARVGTLQQKLGSSMQAQRRLATILKERDESLSNWTAGAVIFLSAAFAVWAVGGGRSVVRAVEEVSVGLYRRIRRESPQEEAAKVIPEAIREFWQKTDPKRPRAWSTWFWASGEDEH